MLPKKKTVALVLLLPLALSISFAVVSYLDIAASIRKIIALVLAAVAVLILALIIILLVSPRSRGSSKEILKRKIELLEEENENLTEIIRKETEKIEEK